MKDIVKGLGWVNAIGAVLGGGYYLLFYSVLFGILYMVIGCIVAVPFFGLASTMQTVEGQAEELESLRAEISSLQKSQRGERAPAFAIPEGKAPSVSGARKLAPEEAPRVVEAPKLDFSKISESDR